MNRAARPDKPPATLCPAAGPSHAGPGCSVGRLDQVPPRRRAGDDRHFVVVVVGGLLYWRRVWSGCGVEIQLDCYDDSVTPTLLPSTADLGRDLGRPSASSVTLQNTTHSYLLF